MSAIQSPDAMENGVITEDLGSAQGPQGCLQQGAAASLRERRRLAVFCECDTSVFTMPELAEVEFFRKQWHSGVGEPVIRIALHPGKRVFRKVSVAQLRAQLPGAVLMNSEAGGKQMLFRFSNNLWLGLHLGMTGKLSVAPAGFRPGKHDHLVLFQSTRALVFTDSRLFGSVQFHSGEEVPTWWSKLPPAITSSQFNRGRVSAFLARHGKLPIKAALLLQSGFPGIGNWMADEILWRGQIHPLTPAGRLTDTQKDAVWRSLRFVCRNALKSIGQSFAEPPRGWLFHERWNGHGRCPKHGGELNRERIGGRTTAWCPQCQPQ